MRGAGDAATWQTQEPNPRHDVERKREDTRRLAGNVGEHVGQAIRHKGAQAGTYDARNDLQRVRRSRARRGTHKVVVVLATEVGLEEHARRADEISIVTEDASLDGACRDESSSQHQDAGPHLGGD